MKVTVVMPCRNAAGFIAQALETALRQDEAGAFEAVRVIVVDGGSSDGRELSFRVEGVGVERLNSAPTGLQTSG